MSLVLSIFPGLDVLGMGFEAEGYCVVRGPDVLWGGDVREFHPPPGVFDGVIGGPPCPAHSRLSKTIAQNGYTPADDLVCEFECCILEAQPGWFLMENAPACREPVVAGYKVHAQCFDNNWLGERQGRLRLIAFGTRDGRELKIPVHPLWPFREHAVTADARPVPVAIGGSGKRKKGADLPPRSIEDCLTLQGLPMDLLDESPFTVEGKRGLIGRAVPLGMAKALAGAVRKAMEK